MLVKGISNSGDAYQCDRLIIIALKLFSSNLAFGYTLRSSKFQLLLWAFIMQTFQSVLSWHVLSRPEISYTMVMVYCSFGLKLTVDGFCPATVWCHARAELQLWHFLVFLGSFLVNPCTTEETVCFKSNILFYWRDFGIGAARLARRFSADLPFFGCGTLWT